MRPPWSLKIISINVNGIKTDMWSKLRHIHKKRYDITLLQETKLTHEDSNDDLTYRWQQISDGEAYTAPAASAQMGGVAILLSAYACSLIKDRHTINILQDQHRHIALKATLLDETIFIHSVYAPVHRSERPSLFTNITTPPEQGSHIVGGDFNCIMDAQTDTRGDHLIATSGSVELATWITSLNAIDAWRTQHEDSFEFTSPTGSSRIDMIFLSGCFTNKFTTTHLPRTIGSDHMCPSATVTSSDICKKGGHWQLPSWLAQKASKTIEPILRSLAERTNHSNYTELFVKAMKNVTTQCKATHKRVLQSRNNRIEIARLRWLRAHQRATANPSDELIADAERTRMTWKREVDRNTERKRAWAFDRHFAEAERCTRFFMTRAKHNGATIIPGVRLPSGAVHNDQTNIQKAHNEYWTKLYSIDAGGTEPALTEQNIVALTNTTIPQLPRANAQMLETDVTTEDITRQIKRLPSRKAAGTDGLRGELFKQAPALWARVLLPVFHRILQETESLPKPFYESVIILLHKKGCTLSPENYRPIALVNVMAKLLSSVYSSRIRRVLHSVIPKEQTGFIPGRSITENIIFLGDALHYAKRHHPSTIILALDFAKAYDRVQWAIMLATLEKMAFGPKFLTTIKAMYKTRTARLSINGELTRPFPIERGVLQGDPLSPALFILALSPLYAKLEAARNTHGIPLPNDRPAPVASYYADDTTIVARSPESAVHLYNLTEQFCSNSGALLHRGKCIAIPAGDSPPALSNGIKILQPSEYTTILGVPMGRDITRQQQVEKVVTKMIGKCEGWAHVGRTIEGRVTIARSVILSTLWYVLAAIPIDREEAKKIQTVVNNYINRKEQTGWGGATVAGNMINQWFYIDKDRGGWGMPHVMRTLKCRKLSFMKRFMKERHLNTPKLWHTFINHMIIEHLHEWSQDWESMFYWNGTQRKGDFSAGNWDAISPWWKDVWREWLLLECAPKRNSIPRAILQCWPIWNNRILCRHHGLQTSLYRAFPNSTANAHMKAIRAVGMTTFKDFINMNGSLMSGEELYTAATVRLSVHGAEHFVPRRACDTLMRYVTELWTNAERKWLKQSAATSEDNRREWWPKGGIKTMFNDANNKTIMKILKANEPSSRSPRTIRLRDGDANICWKREASALAVLAPSRRDLIRRLVRNALPVGAKRVHWATASQTKCMLCDDDKIETAKHMLWDCRFAKETWGSSTLPWRTHRNTPVAWREVVMGYEVRLGQTHDKHVERMWAIVRACIVRGIWFERNRRFFYPDAPRRSPLFRQNQGRDDVKMHVESWLRRSVGKERDDITKIITYLQNAAPAYNNIVIPPRNNEPTTTNTT